MQSEPIPDLECDLVMKGGVTSGIVYPAAIAAIAARYRLRSIGGTSAGAIGAAAAAAMEFGRASGLNPEANRQIAGLADKLGVDVDGRPQLARLFTPDPSTAKLYHDLMGLADAARKRGWPSALASLLILPAVIAFCASSVAAILVAVPAATGHARIAAGLILLLVGFPGLTVLLLLMRWVPRIWSGLKSVADNGYGFCSGTAAYRRRDASATVSLSGWLHEQYQSLANLPPDQPLTFGDLWLAEERAEGRTREQVIKGAERLYHDVALAPRRIELVLVASDINRAQSVQLPFMRANDLLYARLSDLGTLLPIEVVRWMADHAGDPRDLDGADLGGVPQTDLIRLPEPHDMPVLLAVRMSLSFPILFKAVRLYVLRSRAGTNGSVRELAEIWIADGGITSNFPIHLFDAPLPARPTFCLNLLYHDDELEPDRRSPDQASGAKMPDGADMEMLPEQDQGLAPASAPAEELVYMPTTNAGRVSAYTRFGPDGAISRLGRYAGRILTTARQWGDNQLIDIPGYRDRIVHIRMRPGEGGFNFDMDEGKITDLCKRGARAGQVIAGRFVPGETQDPLHPGKELRLNWANHRWVRFRSFVSGMEVAADRYGRNWDLDLAAATKASPSIKTMLHRAYGHSSKLPQYIGYTMRTRMQASVAEAMSDRIRVLVAAGNDPAIDGVDFWKGRPGSPRPKTVVRLRPPGDGDPLGDRPGGASVP